MTGYKEAEIIDKQINARLSDNGITKDNAQGWMNFARTLISGLDMIHKKAIRAARDYPQRRWDDFCE